jgi:hypothetical protein
VLSLQLTAAQNPETTYSTEGDNAEILIVKSADVDNASCSASASGELGSSAAAVGFTEIDCRNSSTGTVYKKPISLQ